jgi:hypothetical protein
MPVLSAAAYDSLLLEKVKLVIQAVLQDPKTPTTTFEDFVVGFDVAQPLAYKLFDLLIQVRPPALHTDRVQTACFRLTKAPTGNDQAETAKSQCRAVDLCLWRSSWCPRDRASDADCALSQSRSDRHAQGETGTDPPHHRLGLEW